MAGILVSDAHGKRFQFCSEAEGGEKFGNVASSCCERARLGVLCFVRRKKMIVFLECGAATGGVGDDGVEVFTKEDGEISSGEIPRSVTDAGVGGEGAAAELSPGDDDFAAVGGENADGGFVELRESDIRDASGEESDAGTAGAGGGVSPSMAAIEKVVIDAREETFALGETEKF